MKSIALIGMPGAGKTVIGKVAALRFKMDFIDLDSFIEEKYGKIDKLFERGEDFFRNTETQALKECIGHENMILSTGGGIVEREENMLILKQKALVIFIDRPVDRILKDIDNSKRPLLKENPEILHKLYERRYEKYKKWADHIIVNDNSIDGAIESIHKVFNK